MAKAYLMFYNILSSFGWAFVLYQVIQSLINGESGKELWNRVGIIVMCVQSLAILEIFHSLFGLVRSPLLPTFMQVMSRILLIWVYCYPTDGAGGHWSLYLMIISWSLVEIPRYLFYVFAINSPGKPHNIPSLLFYFRYNLFIILYPSGITGELLIMYNAYIWNLSFISYRIIAFHHAIYLPLAPFMIFNMCNNKKRAYKKRKQSANPRPLNGLIWPITDKKGMRSTTKTNKAIWLASIDGIDDNITKKCNKERNWRFGYQKHVMNNVELSCKSTKNALAIAQAGLNKAYELFEFKRKDDIISFKKAMKKGYINGSFDTHTIKGKGKLSTELKVPYGGGKYQGKPYYLGKKDKTILQGLELRDQLKKWVEYGTIEPSAADAIALVDTKRNEWLDLSDHYFILLGATSAMGPLYFLLEHGANIIAVDLNRDFIWKKLFAAVENSPGTLIFPVKKGIDDISKFNTEQLSMVSGSDLLGDTPEIANWLTTVIPKDKHVMIGNYTYLDGALHVQLSLACDSIINRLCQERKDLMIAFLCTPTDNHVVTTDAYNASKKQLASVPMWASLLNTIFGGKFLGKSNYKCMRLVAQDKGDPIHIIDGIAVAQGPNYALAKRLQHWRAIIAYSKGHKVSSNVAPSTATQSVVHNAQFAAAYGGMHHFKPMEVMYQRTSLAVMGTLLIHDTMNNDGAANPNSKIGKNMRNPFELFSYGSFHGGVQRCSYKIDKIGVPSALSFYVSQYKFGVIIGSIHFILGLSWLLTGHVSPF